VANEIVMALYRAHPGHEDELAAVVARHFPVLQEQGLVTDRAPMLMRSSDGTWIEIFEWVDGGAERAHTNPAVQEVWGAMMPIADFTTLAELPEADRRFPHFRPATA